MNWKINLKTLFLDKNDSKRQTKYERMVKKYKQKGEMKTWKKRKKRVTLQKIVTEISTEMMETCFLRLVNYKS
jgi:hypothetical protein